MLKKNIIYDILKMREKSYYVLTITRHIDKMWAYNLYRYSYDMTCLATRSPLLLVAPAASFFICFLH